MKTLDDGHARVFSLGILTFAITLNEDHPDVEEMVCDNALMLTGRPVLVDGVWRLRLRLETVHGLELASTLVDAPPDRGRERGVWNDGVRSLCSAMLVLATQAVEWRRLAGAWPGRAEDLARDPKRWRAEQTGAAPDVESDLPDRGDIAEALDDGDAVGTEGADTRELALVMELTGDGAVTFGPGPGAPDRGPAAIDPVDAMLHYALGNFTKTPPQA